MVQPSRLQTSKKRELFLIRSFDALEYWGSL